MKIYGGFFIVALAAVAAAQETPRAAQPAQPPMPAAARVNAELAVAGGWSMPMKNSPFSADEVNESVQTLADGNRIVHNSSGKMYRNSEGRIRRESKGGAGGSYGFSYSVTPSVSIVDPVVGQKFELDSALKTAWIYEMRAGQGVTITGSGANGVGDARAAEELLAKLKAEGRLDKATTVLSGQAGATAPAAAEKALAETAAVLATQAGVYAFSAGGYSTAYPVAAKAKYETKSEDLGTRDFEGVTAEGNRRTTIIPAGANGNERPIEIVYERWYSKELGMVVYSKTDDPRTGEQTYKLTNIVRSEPDPSLFSVPAEYKKIGQSGAPYRVAPTKPVAVKSATAAKPTTAVGRP